MTRILSVSIHLLFCVEGNIADPAIPSVMMLAIIVMVLMAWLTYIESAVLVAVLVISTTSFRTWRIIRIC